MALGDSGDINARLTSQLRKLKYSDDFCKSTLVNRIISEFGGYNGLCHGFAWMGATAVLCEDLGSFDERVRILSTDFQQTVDVQAFCNGVWLYQNPAHNARRLCEVRPKNQQDMLSVMQILLPEQLQHRGGIAEISNFFGIYTEEEWCNYFKTLERTFQAHSVSAPIVLILMNGNHAICVGYTPKNKTQAWSLININSTPTQYFKSAEELSKAAFNDLYKTLSAAPPSKETVITVNTRFFGIAAHQAELQSIYHCWAATNEMQSIHAISKTNAQLVDPGGYSLLLLAAARGGHADIVSALAMLHFATINQTNQRALLSATFNGNIEVMRALIKHGANIHDTSSGITLVQVAAISGQTDAALLLISEGANVNQAECNWTPLHFAAARGYADTVLALIEQGADMTKVNEEGDTPVHCAARNDDVTTFGVFLQNGVDTNLTHHSSRKDEPLLLWAISHNLLRVVKALIVAGARLDKESEACGYTALHLAVDSGKHEIAQILIDECGLDLVVNSATKVPAGKKHIFFPYTLLSGAAPLHRAAFYRHTECIQVLVDRGADVHQANAYGDTPLHILLADRSERHEDRSIPVEEIKLLLEHHANPNQTNEDGDTPFERALIRLITVHTDFEQAGCLTLLAEPPSNFFTVFELMIQFGADLTRPCCGELPIDILKARMSPDTVNRLLADIKKTTIDEATARFKCSP